MNFLGMGPLELLVIAVLAFIVLGPERMVDAGRMLGRAAREVKRLADEMPKLSLDDLEEAATEKDGRGSDERTAKTPGGEETEREGPVSFRPSSQETKEKATERDEQGEDWTGPGEKSA